jgi:hypothetical protein
MVSAMNNYAVYQKYNFTLTPVILKTFKSYMQEASKVICVMQKMREDFAIVG